MAEAAEVRNVILDPQHMQLAEHTMAVFTVNCEIGTTVDDLLDPAYWAHVAPQLQPYYQIWARAEDGEWEAHFSVLSCGRNWAKVMLYGKYGRAGSPVEADETEHKVAWKGPQRKHSIIRISDGAVIKEGFSSRNEALSALVEHERITG